MLLLICGFIPLCRRVNAFIFRSCSRIKGNISRYQKASTYFRASSEKLEMQIWFEVVVILKGYARVFGRSRAAFRMRSLISILCCKGFIFPPKNFLGIIMEDNTFAVKMCAQGGNRTLQVQYPDWIFYSRCRSKKCSIGLRFPHGTLQASSLSHFVCPGWDSNPHDLAVQRF
jgi:hypothetical protein